MDNITGHEPTTTPPTTEKPEQKRKEKPKCSHCGRELPNKGALKMHENACEKNPNKTPKKSKTGSAGDKGAVEAPKKSEGNTPWYNRHII